MIRQNNKSNTFFDSNYCLKEQLPRVFFISFNEIYENEPGEVRLVFNDTFQVGDVISDNSNGNDFYRYHDVFHYSFASLLGWSPCTRSMLKCKRKSNPNVDEIEDGARAAITEEAISLLIFNEAKRKNFFQGGQRLSRSILRIIKEMTETFEVKSKHKKDWENAILQAYNMFRLLIENRGGKVKFDAINKSLEYIHIN